MSSTTPRNLNRISSIDERLLRQKRRTTASSYSLSYSVRSSAPAKAGHGCAGRGKGRTNTDCNGLVNSQRLELLAITNDTRKPVWRRRRRSKEEETGRAERQRVGAGAFTKLIEIAPARAIARALMVPARYLVDGLQSSSDERGNNKNDNNRNARKENDRKEIVYVPDFEREIEIVNAEMLRLSGYDVGEVPFVMQAVMYYRESLDAGVLRTSLAKTLKKYPILAGRLDLKDAREKGARLCNFGVPFRVVNETFERTGWKTIDDLPMDFASESRRFLDFAPWIDLMLGDAPAFTVKITNLPNNKGSVLGVCMSHAISDGQGFVEFLITWAEIAKGNEGHPLGDPIFDRNLLPIDDIPKTNKEINEMLMRENFVGAGSVDTLVNAVKAGRALAPDFLRFPAGNRTMIKIPRKNIENLKLASKASNENEALSAHAWLQLSKLSGLPIGADFQHVTVVSARGGSKGLPPMYFGNACIGVKTAALKVGDCGDDVAKARDLIKPGLRKMLKDRSKYLMLTESAFRAGVNAYDWDCLAFMAGEMCWCNNLVEIYKKLYELDFGTGTPELALPPELNDIVQINASRPTEPGMPAGENGVEMFVNMPPRVMERVNMKKNISILAGDRY